MLPFNEIHLALTDAIKDTFEIIPFLLLIFYIIEVVEFFYSDKISEFSKFSKKFGPFTGAIFASIPQCGLSVVASTLYCRKLITKGTLIGVYLATSDEAIPVLLANPEGCKILIPLISIKIFVGILAGYLIDFLFPSEILHGPTVQQNDIKIEKGCHHHSFSREDKKELIFHPLIHTLSVSFFVLIVTFVINLVFAGAGVDFSNLTFLSNKFVQPVLTALAGLIPNCAVSVGITVLYLKSAITFASCISGLCASAGLGILVLFKNNESKRDALWVISALFLISILTGFLFLKMG